MLWHHQWGKKKLIQLCQCSFFPSIGFNYFLAIEKNSDIILQYWKYRCNVCRPLKHWILCSAVSGACVTAILSVYTTCSTVITLLIIITDEGASLPAVAFWCKNYGVIASKYNLTEYWNSTKSQQYKHLIKHRQPTNSETCANSEWLVTIASVDCIVSYKDASCSMILLLSDMLVRLGWCECVGTNVLGIWSSNIELMQCSCAGIILSFVLTSQLQK